MKELKLIPQLAVGLFLGGAFFTFFMIAGCDEPRDWCITEDNSNWIPWVEGTIEYKEIVKHPSPLVVRKVIELTFDNNKKVKAGYIKDFSFLKVGQTGILYKYNRYQEQDAWFQWIISDDEEMCL